MFIGKASKRFRLLVANYYLRLFKPGWVGASRVRLALDAKSRPVRNNLWALFPFWPLHQMNRLHSLIKNEFPDHRNAILERAQDYLNGDYRLLEENKRNFKTLSVELAGRFRAAPTHLPWHYDWLRPHRWDPRKTYLDSAYDDLDGIDPKLPWELSRFGHLITLAQAACLTQEERFLEEIAAQLEDWHKNNPPGFGINWASTLEAGIRASHVLFALGLIEETLKAYPKIRSRIQRLLPSFIFNHTQHILKNLEAPTNHLLGNLTGLIFLSSLYPYFEYSGLWKESGWRELRRQIKIQVYSDGMDFEASTCYHRLVTEFFLYSWLLMEKSALPKFEEFPKKLRLMIKALEIFMKPNGDMPQIGDNDSGRFLPLAPERQALDATYLLGIGAAIFPDLKFQVSKHCFPPEALWLLGPDALQKKSLISQSPLYQELPEGGIYVFKDPAQGHYLAISLSRNGQGGWGGHAHNDRLGFHLSAHGEDLFVDPGTGVYLRNRLLRDHLRSTKFHNTLAVSDEEQNEMNNGPFRLNPNVQNPAKIQSSMTQDSFSWTGEHDGYLKRASLGVLHRRHFQLHCPQGRFFLEIKDELLGAQNQKNSSLPVFWNFNVSPEIEIQAHGGGLVSLKTKKGAVYEFKTDLPLEILPGWHSPEFGVIRNAKRIIARIQAPLSRQCIFTLSKIA